MSMQFKTQQLNQQLADKLEAEAKAGATFDVRFDNLDFGDMLALLDDVARARGLKGVTTVRRPAEE